MFMLFLVLHCSKISLRWKSLYVTVYRRKDRSANSGDRLCSCHFKDGKKENGASLFPWNKDKRLDFSEVITKRSRLVLWTEVHCRNNSFYITLQSFSKSKGYPKKCWVVKRKFAICHTFLVKVEHKMMQFCHREYND